MAKKPMMKKEGAMEKGKAPMKDASASAGLTAAQKKLPPALQAAIMKKKKK